MHIITQYLLTLVVAICTAASLTDEDIAKILDDTSRGDALSNLDQYDTNLQIASLRDKLRTLEGLESDTGDLYPAQESGLLGDAPIDVDVIQHVPDLAYGLTKRFYEKGDFGYLSKRKQRRWFEKDDFDIKKSARRSSSPNVVVLRLHDPDGKDMSNPKREVSNFDLDDLDDNDANVDNLKQSRQSHILSRKIKGWLAQGNMALKRQTRSYGMGGERFRGLGQFDADVISNPDISDESSPEYRGEPLFLNRKKRFSHKNPELPGRGLHQERRGWLHPRAMEPDKRMAQMERIVRENFAFMAIKRLLGRGASQCYLGNLCTYVKRPRRPRKQNNNYM